MLFIKYKDYTKIFHRTSLVDYFNLLDSNTNYLLTPGVHTYMNGIVGWHTRRTRIFTVQRCTSSSSCARGTYSNIAVI